MQARNLQYAWHLQQHKDCHGFQFNIQRAHIRALTLYSFVLRLGQ